jgi:hypothetical protein
MAPLPIGSSTALTVDYRYILTDTLTDTVLAEIPFVDVTYSNAINEAGSFSGSFPVTPETSVQDLYNNTLPGKTSLYVLRNGQCVWGGIISSRSYDVREKILDITADDFLSYLDRRVVWKTLSTEFSCEIEIFEDPLVANRMIGKVTLIGEDTHEQFNLEPGRSKVGLYFGEELISYLGNYTVLDDETYGVDTVNYKFFHFGAYFRPGTSVNFRPMQAQNISSEVASVRFRQDTDDYLNTLLSEHFADDLADLSFANDSVAPAEVRRVDISTYARANNIATLTTVSTNEEDEEVPYAHGLVPGQLISIKNFTTFNATNVPVLSVPDEFSFTYASEGTSVGTTAISAQALTRSVDRFIRVSDIVTITTTANHGFSVGDIVNIQDLDPRIDSDYFYTITRIGTSSNPGNPTQFQFESVGEKINSSKAAAGTTVERNPIVEYYTAGSYTGNSDLGITFDTPASLTTVQAFQQPVRGSEVNTFKEVIDKYANDLIGFDYRVDCSFNSSNNTFSKEFKFLPLFPDSLAEAINNAGGTLPSDELPKISYFSVDGRKAGDIAFEFPGNINSVQMVESLEEGANRIFTQGSTEVANSQPAYAAAVDRDFLRDGWPLYDKVIKKDKVYYSSDLYQISSKVMSQAQLPVATFSITVNGTLNPNVGSYRPGDWCTVYIEDPFVIQRLNSYYENKGDNSRNILLRKISKISVQLSNNPVLPEEVTLELVTEPGIDITGAERAWR